jgi:hypothetical protein
MAHILAAPGVRYSPKDITKLETYRQQQGAAIACAGSLVQHWSNGNVRKVLNFEHDPTGGLPKNADNPPPEPEAYARDRWNPFYGLSVVSPTLYEHLAPLTREPQALLSFALTQHHHTIICDDVVVHHTPQWSWRTLTPRGLLRHSQCVRDCVLSVRTAIYNLYHYWQERVAYRAHYEAIAEIKRNKVLILDLEFGGLGDCLSYSTLPRRLKENFDIDFYLSERCRETIRHPDFARVVFEMNPYCKGYRSGPAFFPRVFLRDASWLTILTGRGGRTAVAEIERQFGLQCDGNPTIAYQPKKIPGYETVLLCDQNWHSGKKLGLYNDPTLLRNVLVEWEARGPTYRVEYIEPSSQDLTTYIDKIYSCGHFVCFLSGGNSLAAALKKPATVVLPENIEGGGITQFLFLSAPTTYLRRRPIRGVPRTRLANTSQT